uniref:Uncharacterized protein n=1 Tax=Setaria viridis TaxID=4556 RepID=A0A4U6VJS2_SETVI|nr:hypothetical protein SEVIR_3G352900v2 [Setaria viridis]
MYEAQPLCEDDAHTLFFRRIFLSSEDCPQVLRAVATEVLRKCGGLPLAIISISGLLANRCHRVEEWENISNSISSAVGTASQIQKMKRILFLSYFDLPHHLKSCLLYLSVFPEDYSIDCRRLIRTWVAEGLIPGQNTESMEQVGESYLNALINRSMVQPTKIRAGGAVKFCRVHDVIFDFIVSQAVEDNFVVIWNGKDFSGNFSNKMRRLSIQTDFSEAEEMAKELKNTSHLRSVHIFNDSDQLGDYIPQFFSSHALRVLNIQGKCLFGDRNVHIESFTPLKYLVITGRCSELPEQIGKLQHLETLDVKRSGINKLPASIVQLKKLVRLFVPAGVQLPEGIGNMQALEELSTIELGISSAKVIQELGDLTKLRFLIVFSYYTTEACDVEGHRKASVSTLSKLLMGLRTLYLAHDSVVATALMASCRSTPQMRSFVNLVRLRISVQGKVTKKGIEILASLPMLASLTVRLRYNGDNLHPRHSIRKQGFQSLLKFSFGGDQEAALEFEPGAMPKVQSLKVELQARCQFKYGQGGLVVGLQNLAALKHVNASINCFKAAEEEVQGSEDDIRGTSGTHPNHLTLVVKREHSDAYDSSDDQLNK